MLFTPSYRTLLSGDDNWGCISIPNKYKPLMTELLKGTTTDTVDVDSKSRYNEILGKNEKEKQTKYGLLIIVFPR